VDANLLDSLDWHWLESLSTFFPFPLTENRRHKPKTKPFFSKLIEQSTETPSL
jgi:hypothetical protein